MKKINLQSLLFFLLAPLPILKADDSGDINIDALNAHLDYELVHLSQDVCHSILALNHLLPNHTWSTTFKNLSLDIEDEGTIALCDDVKNVVDESLDACKTLPPDQSDALQASLEEYKKHLGSGQARITFSDDADEISEQTQTRGCGGSNVKKICKLSVKCLSINGSLYVNGVDFTTLLGLAGSIGATGPAGIQGVAGFIGAIGAAGPAGAQGIAGALGAIGAAGAAGVIGVPGTPGIAGLGGVLGYTYACNTAAQVVPAGGIVTFNNSAEPSSRISPPAPGSSTFTILFSGVYYIQYHVRGTPGTLSGANGPSALSFQVTVFNGVTTTPITCATYASSVQITSLAAAGTESVSGFVVVHLTAGNFIRLQNITNSSTDSVTLAAVPIGGTSAVSASLLIMQVA
jgi:hypothetical protein